jgi:hypothetical protein
MTKRTIEIIKTNKSVHATVVGPMPNGKYGIYIGILNRCLEDDENTSSFSTGYRPQPLLSSDGIFDTIEETLAAGKEILQHIKDTE